MLLATAGLLPESLPRPNKPAEGGRAPARFPCPWLRFISPLRLAARSRATTSTSRGHVTLTHARPARLDLISVRQEHNVTCGVGSNLVKISEQPDKSVITDEDYIFPENDLVVHKNVKLIAMQVGLHTTYLGYDQLKMFEPHAYKIELAGNIAFENCIQDPELNQA